MPQWSLSVLGVKDLTLWPCMLPRLWASCFWCAAMWNIAFLLLLDWQECRSLLACSPPWELFSSVSLGQLYYSEDSLNLRIFFDIRHVHQEALISHEQGWNMNCFCMLLSPQNQGIRENKPRKITCRCWISWATLSVGVSPLPCYTYSRLLPVQTCGCFMGLFEKGLWAHGRLWGTCNKHLIPLWCGLFVLVLSLKDQRWFQLCFLQGMTSCLEIVRIPDTWWKSYGG